MFSCRVCKEKDKRLEDLQKQMDFLKSMLQPNMNSVHAEAETNFIMNGASEEQLSLSEEQQARLEKEQYEAAVILSGTY